MNYLSKIMVDKMEIPEEDRELYEYGVIIVLKKLLFYSIMAVAFMAMGRIYEGVCLLVTFACLRRNAGGLHCKSDVACFLLSVGSVLGSVVIIQYGNIAIWYYRYAVMISEILLLMMKPIDCENKRVEQEEKVYFYNQEKRTLLVTDIFLILMAIGGFADVEKAVESAVILVACTSVIAFGKRESKKC